MTLALTLVAIKFADGTALPPNTLIFVDTDKYEGYAAGIKGFDIYPHEYKIVQIELKSA